MDYVCWEEKKRRWSEENFITLQTVRKKKKEMKEREEIAFLFDLDGVVFDTEHYYSEFWAEEGRKYRPEVEHLEMKIKGRGLKDIYREYFHDEKTQELIREDLKKMEKEMRFNYIAGVEKFVRSIHEKGIKICLVTSSKDDKMERVFRARPEIKEYFPLRVTADDIEHSKPSPDCYLMGSKKCGVEAKKCIVFEDSLAGIEAAQRAEMRVIALSTTYTEEELREKTEEIIKDFEGIRVEDFLD